MKSLIVMIVLCVMSLGIGLGPGSPEALAGSKKRKFDFQKENERGSFLTMQKVLVYTTSFCPYCVRAKNLLQRKGVAYEEVDVGNDQDLRALMTQKTGGRTSVPQIFIGEAHVGGCDDLYALEDQGKLDDLLGKS